MVALTVELLFIMTMNEKEKNGYAKYQTKEGIFSAVEGYFCLPSPKLLLPL